MKWYNYTKIVKKSLIWGLAFVVWIVMNSYPENFMPYIDKASKKYRIHKYIICRIIEVESSWNKKAVSKKNAVGLMQVTKGVYYYFAYENKDYDFLLELNYKIALKNAEWNILIGTWYLRKMFDYFKNHKKAISAYFWGLHNIRKNKYNHKYYNKVMKIRKNKFDKK